MPLACTNSADDPQALDTTAPAVLVCQQSPPVPGFIEMDRLSDNAIEQIFEHIVECLEDVTNAMLISTL
ncbi:hypothetical protein KCU91_g1041, partial [Aureobasidium melanogenum]